MTSLGAECNLDQAKMSLSGFTTKHASYSREKGTGSEIDVGIPRATITNLWCYAHLHMMPVAHLRIGYWIKLQACVSRANRSDYQFDCSCHHCPPLAKPEQSLTQEILESLTPEQLCH